MYAMFWDPQKSWCSHIKGSGLIYIAEEKELLAPFEILTTFEFCMGCISQYSEDMPASSFSNLFFLTISYCSGLFIFYLDWHLFLISLGPGQLVQLLLLSFE